MTFMVTLDPETEDAILRKANRLGLSPSDYLQRLAEKDTHRRKTAPASGPEESFGNKWRAAFGDRPPGSGESNWSEVEAACDTH